MSYSVLDTTFLSTNFLTFSRSSSAVLASAMALFKTAVMVENGRDGAGVGARLAGDVLRAAFELEQP